MKHTVARLVKQLFIDLRPIATPARRVASSGERGPRFWGGGTTGGRDFVPGEHRAVRVRSHKVLEVIII
jgi:hypothetical protein